MNMPRPEFACGISQEACNQDWRLPYRHQIYVFERHLVQQPKCDLLGLINRWVVKKQKLPSGSGHVHRVQYPPQPEMEMMAWTAHRAFHLRNPADNQEAPTQLVLFLNLQQLTEWRRNYWRRNRVSPMVSFQVHAGCYQPNGQRISEPLLTFSHG